MGGQHYRQPRYDRLRPASGDGGARSQCAVRHHGRIPHARTARAVCVIVLLTFIAVGILLARAVLGVQP